MRENFLTPDLSISGNFKQLWFWWQKSPPPDEGKFFWHQIYPFQAILSNFGFGGRKAPPPPRWGTIFWHKIYPFQAISSNFGFVGRKATPLWDEGKFFDTRSIHFRQFQATLVLVAEKPPPWWGKIFLTPDLSISGNFKQLLFWWQKPPPPQWGKIFWHQIYPFQAISSNFGFVGRKATPLWDEGKFFDTRSIHFRQFQATLVLMAEKPPPPPPMKENFLTPDLSISGNFKQLLFWWQKSPPPKMRENFLTPDLPFQAISSNFGFVGRKATPLWDEGSFFDTRSIHFRQFQATLGLVAEKPPPQDKGKFFWHQIYPFQAISRNFDFGGRKAPPPQDEGKFFDTRSIHFRQFQATLVLVAETPPPSKIREVFLIPDLSISGNFKQLWFWWQKSPPPPRWRKIFWHQIYPFQAISSNFGLGGRKGPLPPRMKEIFLTQDLSISGNFKQLWFCWKKTPPTPLWDEGQYFWHKIYPFQAISSNFGFVGRKATPLWDEGKFFDTRSIHFRQFQATFVLVAEKPSPQDEGKFFDTRSIHFRQFQATFVLVAEKGPLLPNEGKFFDTRSIHFRQFQATLVWLAEKPPPLWDEGKYFWHKIYPFQAISSNFGFDGRKAPPPKMKQNFWHQIYPFQAISSNFWFWWQKSPPPPKMKENFLTPDLSISGNFKQLWFWWQKSPPSDEGSFCDTRSIHFRQFQATLVLVAEKPPPPKIKDNFLTPDLSISGNFKQLWFWWQKSPPPMKENFWHQIYPFQAISSNFGLGGRNPPPPRMKEIFLTQDLSISGNFKQLWFCWQKSHPRWRKIFDTRSIHFRQFQATVCFGGRKAIPPRWGKNFWHQIYPFQAISSNFGFGGRKGPLLPNEGKFLTPDLSILGNFEQLLFGWQKTAPPQDEGKYFWHQIYPFQAISSNFGFDGRKATPPLRWGKIFLTLDLSISGNFKQLLVWWQKSPPSQWRKFFLTPDLSISGNFK